MPVIRTMKEFIQAIFCAPTGKYDDLPFPSRLTDEVFKALKEAGINRIFGYGYDIREETQVKTLELCEKYGIYYLPTMYSFGKYVSLGNGDEKAFCDLTEEEKTELDKEFVAEVAKYRNYPAFKGVFFGDEAGYLSFDGVARAKRVFDENYPDLEFHFNFFSYSINDDIFWYGMANSFAKKPNLEKPFKLDGDLAVTFKNRFNFYDKLVDGLVTKAKFEYLSQDKYPFESFWESVPTSVHVALFELNAYFAEKKKKVGCKFYNYMQAGQWATGTKRTKMTEGETALQAHVTVAYGHEGFAYFPGCYPIDYAKGKPYDPSGKGGAGLIDINGNKADVYERVRELNGFFSEIADDILSSEFKGVWSYGKYYNGFTENEIKNLPDNECIFRGELPEMCKMKDETVSVKSTNEVMVSTFERNGKKRYYLVNLSTTEKNEVEAKFESGEYVAVTEKGKIAFKDAINITFNEGQGVYVIRK